MIRRIYRYTLNEIALTEIEIPAGSSVVHVANQNGSVCLWAEIEAGKTSMQKRTFFITGTGHNIENDAAFYVGTALCPPFVWHVYEVMS